MPLWSTHVWTSATIRAHTRACPILHQASDLIADPRGEVIEVKVLRVDPDERKIGLSRKRVEWAEEVEAEAAQPDRSANSVDITELKGGVGDSSGPLFKHPVQSPPSVSDSEGSSEKAD